MTVHSSHIFEYIVMIVVTFNDTSGAQLKFGYEYLVFADLWNIFSFGCKFPNQNFSSILIIFPPYTKKATALPGCPKSSRLLQSFSLLLSMCVLHTSSSVAVCKFSNVPFLSNKLINSLNTLPITLYLSPR